MRKKWWILAGLWLFISQTPGFTAAPEPYLTNAALVAAYTAKQGTPQAPRVSPDGKRLLYELYTPDKCEIWICDSDGKNKLPVTQELQKTGKFGPKVENAFWHPSQKYIAFNEAPHGNYKDGFVYIAGFLNNKITKWIYIEDGARPQFSKPNGNVLFHEATVRDSFFDDTEVNTIKYRSLGADPLNPDNDLSIELRGPIQEIRSKVELSHPSLAPDGTTILFAARTSTIKEHSLLRKANITDANRQRAVALWKEIVINQISTETLTEELDKCVKNKVSLDLNSLSLEDPNQDLSADETDTIKELIYNLERLNGQPTVIKGYTRKDLVICWLMNLLSKLDLSYEGEIEKNVYSRVWMTDVFGAPIVPLVDDQSNVPLPQKWATVSKTGRFAVFEAGYFQNRHLYFVNLKNHHALKLTNAGTYNSSPEISPDEQWIYFESNRSGNTGIWRAQINPEQLLKETEIVDQANQEGTVNE